MRKKRLIFGWVLVIVFAMILVACSDQQSTSTTSENENEQGGSEQTGGEQAGSDQGAITIGMTSALTGPYNEFGEGNLKAVQLAIKQWNEAGGIDGKRIELVALDDQLNPDKASINMQQLIDNEKVVGIIGPAGSGPALATVPMTEAANKIHMNPIAQTVEITYPNGIGKPPRSNVFSFALQNDVEATVLADFVGERFQNIAILHESTAYGVSGAELIGKILKEKYGKSLVAVEQYNQQDADMTAQLARINSANADVLICIGLGSDLANIRKGMSRMNMDIPLVASNGSLSATYREGAGDLVVGTIGSMMAALGQEEYPPHVQAFLDAYLAEYGKDRYWGDGDRPDIFMSINVVNAYDATNVLLEGIKRAGSTETEAIIKAIEDMEPYQGVNATYDFSPEQRHGILPEHVGMFTYVKEGDEIKLVPYKD